MATFYKSDSIPEAVEDDITRVRPLNTLVIVGNATSAVMYRSTQPDNTLAAAYDSGWTVADDDYQSFGTSRDFRAGYDSAQDRLEIEGLNVTAGGATGDSSDFYLDTGNRTVNDAVVGSPGSGDITIITGATDVTTAAGTSGATGTLALATGASDTNFAGATGGGTGPINITTGSAASTVGNLSGDSGAITIGTGSSADGNSGGISLTPGAAAAGTRGHVAATGLRVVQGVTETGDSILDNAGSPYTLTLADSGATFVVDQTGGVVINLPAPAAGNRGARYRFFLVTAAAANVTVTPGGATLLGRIIENDATPTAPGGAGTTLTFVAGTAVVGDVVEVWSTGANWCFLAVTGAAGGITLTP